MQSKEYEHISDNLDKLIRVLLNPLADQRPNIAQVI